MCYKILNSEVSLNCNFSIYQIWLIWEATSINNIRNSPLSMNINIFSVMEFVTFGMLYPILCLMYHLLIILEDCWMKLTFLNLQCCCDCLLLLFCWAYVSGYMPFMSSEYVHVLCSYSLNGACLLARLNVASASPRTANYPWKGHGQVTWTI